MFQSVWMISIDRPMLKFFFTKDVISSIMRRFVIEVSFTRGETSSVEKHETVDMLGSKGKNAHLYFILALVRGYFRTAIR